MIDMIDIYDRYMFLCSHFSIVTRFLNFVANLKVLILAIRPQRMTLLVKAMVTILRKGFFTLISGAKYSRMDQVKSVENSI